MRWPGRTPSATSERRTPQPGKPSCPTNRSPTYAHDSPGSGPAEAVPSTDGWELVVGETIGYLVDDRTRWQAVANLRRVVGTTPEQVLAAPESLLLDLVVGIQPAQQVARLRRCAELAIAGAP